MICPALSLSPIALFQALAHRHLDPPPPTPMKRIHTPPLPILPPPKRPPLTVAEALRNIAAEALERRLQTAELTAME